MASPQTQRASLAVPTGRGRWLGCLSPQEEELEQFFAPEGVLAEEERLRKEREEAEAQEDPPSVRGAAPPADLMVLLLLLLT